jgi:hypothetical protein
MSADRTSFFLSRSGQLCLELVVTVYDNTVTTIIGQDVLWTYALCYGARQEIMVLCRLLPTPHAGR